MIHENIELTGSFIVSGSFVLPSHPNTGSVTALTGSMYHDTTDNILKVYTGNAWKAVGEQTASAAGGPAGPPDIEYLVIAGGGGGGSYGGGGAGGYLSSSLSSIESGSSITVTVGAGGAGSGNSYSTEGTAGVDSSIASAAGTSFTTATSIGGGGGGDNLDGADDGGSGGGGSDGPNDNTGGTGTVGQGNDGGDGTYSDPHYMGGGGGGAGTAGADATTSAAGDGGNGLASTITGTSITRAGGGGGVRYNTSGTWGDGGTGGGGDGGTWNATTTAMSSNTAGTENTGGGGGAGKSGGNGVVILAYNSGSGNGAGGIVGAAGNGRKYHQFNTTGTFKVGSTSDFTVDTTSLQFYYDAGDYASRGTSTITDTQGNYNGTANGASFVLGNNHYWTFNGTNHYISNSFTRPASAQTFMFWVRYLGNGANGYNLSGFQENPAYFYIGRINSTNDVYYYAGNGNASGTISSSTIANNVWVLQTLTMDASGNTTVYTNTTSIHTGADGVGSAGTHTFQMGAINSNSPNYFINADVGIVAYYTKHFSSSDVTDFYNATKTNFV